MGSRLRANREMKSILLLCLTTVSIKALVLPLSLNLGGNKAPALKSIETCPGHEDDVMVVIDGTTDEEICMPGTFPITVPCLDVVGSCEYDICSYIENMSDILCPVFPAYQPCSCPLLAGEFVLEGVETPVQDMGPILGAVMEGDYEATATLYGASDKDRILGCMKLTFALKQC